MHKTTPNCTVQAKSEEKCSLVQRLDKLRVTLQLNWAEMAVKVGLSESMLYQVKAGKKNLSDKAIYRLEMAERESGLSRPVEISAAAALATEMGGSDAEKQANFTAITRALFGAKSGLLEALDELAEIKERVDRLHKKIESDLERISPALPKK